MKYHFSINLLPLLCAFADQFKVVQKNMAGEPVLPTEEGFGDADRP